MNFSFSLPIGCEKALVHPNYRVKVLIGLKKGPSRSKWFSYRLQICTFSGLVIGWWSKLRAAHPYPTQVEHPREWGKIESPYKILVFSRTPWQNLLRISPMKDETLFIVSMKFLFIFIDIIYEL